MEASHLLAWRWGGLCSLGNQDRRQPESIHHWLWSGSTAGGPRRVTERPPPWAAGCESGGTDGAPTAGCPSTPLEARGPGAAGLVLGDGSAAVPLLAAHCCLSSPSTLAGCPLQGLVPSHCHHSGLRTAACDSGDTTWSVHNRCRLYALPEQPPTRPPLEPGCRVDACGLLRSVWPTWLAGRVSLDLKSDQPGRAPLTPRSSPPSPRAPGASPAFR